MTKLESPPTRPLEPSVLLVMHERLRAIDVRDEDNVEAKFLPYGVKAHKNVCRQMFQHRSLTLILSKLSTAVFNQRQVAWKSEFPSWSAPALDTLIPADEGDDIVMSVTCFTDKPTTYAVMYGCTKDTMDQAGDWLMIYKKSAFHPLMLPMIFVELERKRLLNLLEKKDSDLRQRILDMENKLGIQKKKPDNAKKQSPTEKDCEAINLWIDVSTLKNGIESLKAQLVFMIEHSRALPEIICKPDKDGAHQCHSECEANLMIQSRLEEMIAELDGKARSCEALLGAMTLASRMEWNYYSRQDAMQNAEIAKASKKESSQMKAIAMLGMIFLPGTFLASLFSMSFFNWTPADSSQRISPWIAVYVGITVVMTGGIFLGWRTWSDKVDNSAKEEQDAAMKHVSDDGSSMV
ncbi:hypothetical protein F4779DRAFT_405981 [Xylariaceae sp. FL0662B]|nr:hypothetical protein F4779DRAFT_405981 [Xylariaceae sp. FL0662B]